MIPARAHSCRQPASYLNLIRIQIQVSRASPGARDDGDIVNPLTRAAQRRLFSLQHPHTVFTQIPVDNTMVAHGTKAAFKFKEGSDVFTPKDLIELSRPGSGVANVPGDLILVPVSKYSFEDKKYVRVSSSPACFEVPLFLSSGVFGVGLPCLCPMFAHTTRGTRGHGT